MEFVIRPVLAVEVVASAAALLIIPGGTLGILLLLLLGTLLQRFLLLLFKLLADLLLLFGLLILVLILILLILVLVLILILILVLILVLILILVRRILQLVDHIIDILLQLFRFRTVSVRFHGSCTAMCRKYGSGRPQLLDGILHLLLSIKIREIDLLDHGQSKIDTDGAFLPFRRIQIQRLLIIADGPGIVPLLVCYISKVVVGQIPLHQVHLL